ncbi:aminoacyl--tRNA ligase-related protein [Pseudomonas plecoglossicida]|uniref:serine--tRNA ligase n=1 Tax=Pseudomonas plecoglossicida TaxID=70775 RepID=A0AAD0QY26_PSEDL|nr:aminoacyl--tRNA ligase-related protein [Pseudomonas plecoglossicida]AXM97090.1 serine--tRNA ligase [Pseudomonas plecoglossicida]EPB95583.1 seryl-tRNA ligase [Pseudomonas plecoglossicida NB2011]QLB53542.1 serine--tRNA ligase [Pseudomonas plecoglossicida]
MNGPRSPNTEQGGQVEVRRWGSPRQFDFEIKSHAVLGEECGGLSFLAAAKLSGPRFVNLRGPIARMSRALGQFVLNVQTEEHGYEEHYAPCLLKAEMLDSTGQLSGFEDDLFKTSHQNGADLYLTPSAELSLINMVACLALDGDQLPIKMVMLTPCFRSEAGGAGADTFVTVRQRQYDEVGLIQVVTPSELGTVHEAVISHVEYVMRLLGIPYRVMARRVNDLGIDAVYSYVLEVWIPSRGSYRTISSCMASDFQSRRIQARLVGPNHCQVTLAYAVSYNLAVNLLLFAVLENYQQADGSIRVPEVLRSYMSGVSIAEGCLIAHGLETP